MGTIQKCKDCKSCEVKWLLDCIYLYVCNFRTPIWGWRWRSVIRSQGTVAWARWDIIAMLSQRNHAGNQQKGGQIKSWRIFINFFAVLQVEENIKVRRSSSIVLEYCRQILFHFYNLLLMLSCYAKPLAWKHCLNLLRYGLHILKCLNNIMECEKSLFLQNVLFLFFGGVGDLFQVLNVSFWLWTSFTVLFDNFEGRGGCEIMEKGQFGRKT